MRLSSAAMSISASDMVLISLPGPVSAGLDDGEPPLPLDNAGKCTRPLQREDDDRQLVVARECDGCRIHDLEVLLEHLVIADAVVALGVRVLLRVAVVDAVDLGALEQDLARHL